MITAEQIQQLLDAQRTSFAALFSEMQKSLTPAGKNKRKELEDRIIKFNCDPDGGVNFEVWYRKYALIFEEGGSNLKDREKVEVLLLKLGQREHERYVKFILQTKPVDISFEETIKNLKSLFSFSKLLFNRRYQCFNIERQPHEDYFDLADRLNDAYYQADLEQATSSQIKALLFIKLLTLPEDADARTRLLAQLDQKAEMTVQQLAEEQQNNPKN
ncbi:unnamed protein product [Schistocephalus solidus]|uniref:DUF7083 domain-containing protein n=1 Tax=Schistocephalus solidus TaxID=70667 RepID=A0A183TFC8_SCHSO|nr:unnamed protein product [Schistocephalus solidus]